MCNLYSLTKGQAAIRELARAMGDQTGNLPVLTGIFPDYPAPIVRSDGAERELLLARWGMPDPRSLVERPSPISAIPLVPIGADGCRSPTAASCLLHRFVNTRIPSRVRPPPGFRAAMIVR